MGQLQIISTSDAPAAVGPYSQAVVQGGLVYTAGQIALDPETMQLVGANVARQTERVFLNLQAVLEAAGASLQTVVKTTVFLSDMNDFAAMNEVYAAHFGEHRPARSTVQAAALPKGAAVEIEAIAAVSGA